MWNASQRLIEYEENNQQTVILHFGDHDPSGIDMTRDIRDRLSTFESEVQVKRIALNMDQIDHYGPPPNPAKLTDSRAQEYVLEYGSESWELDALEPKVLTALVVDEVEKLLDEDAWEESSDRETAARLNLKRIANHWDQVVEEFGE